MFQKQITTKVTWKPSRLQLALNPRYIIINVGKDPRYTLSCRVMAGYRPKGSHAPQVHKVSIFLKQRNTISSNTSI